jgi:threonine synthase
VTTAVLQKLAESGAIGSDERVVIVITGEGLKTLDAVRDSFMAYLVDPTIESFEAAFADQVHV